MSGIRSGLWASVWLAAASALPTPDLVEEVAPPPAGTIAGEIVFETAPLTAAPSLSDEQGRFQFHGLQPGRQQLRFSMMRTRTGSMSGAGGRCW